MIKIALAGNPNSGKTTLYNALTGKSEKVGNWAGVTVDKKVSPIKSSFGKDISIIDLPGAYSMNAFTSEESITSEFIKNEQADVIINIVDATNISRSLFFTTQLLELGVPVVVALNKKDLKDKKGTVLDIETLAEKLNCPVVETVSTNNSGLTELVNKALLLKGTTQVAPYKSPVYDELNNEETNKADKDRFRFVNDIVKEVEERKILTSDKSFSDKLDSILAHKYLGILIFAVVMYLVFYISQTLVGPMIADLLVGWIETFAEYVRTSIAGSSDILQAILVDGIILGVGAVVGFLPLVMVMYFLIALLEDSGYMARVAVIMDRFFKKVGLSGKSIIPMVIGIGCAIPGVMASRTIKNERERRTTAMLTPFMPCGAKLPVIALFASVFFPGAAWVTTLTYFVGIVLIALGALLVLKVNGIKKPKSYFIIELPEYKVPSFAKATFSMFDRAKDFIIKAGTIILLCNATIQIMQMFNFSFDVVENSSESILATLSAPFAVLLIPLGFGTWQLAAAAITGFIAKENVVGTLAVVFMITNFINPDELALVEGYATEVAAVMNLTQVSAMAYLMFNLYTPPCFAAIGAMNAEMGSKKWLFGGLALQFGVAYVLSFLIYQIGTLLTLGTLGEGFIPGLIVVILIIAYVVYRIQKANKKVKA